MLGEIGRSVGGVELDVCPSRIGRLEAVMAIDLFRARRIGGEIFAQLVQDVVFATHEIVEVRL